MENGTKTAIILGIIILGVVGGVSFAFSTLEAELESTQKEQTLETNSGIIDKSNFKKAPELVGIANYINTTPEELQKEIENKVVMYDIWTYSCINCVRTLPYITAWDSKYEDDGLLVIGIHSPEFEFEKELSNVQMAVEKHGINYPVVLDNEMDTWKAFENRYWPRKYIADHEGYIRYDHIGEGGYKETEEIIQKLLKERADSLGMQVATTESFIDLEEFEHTSFRTPELYFGYGFAKGRNQLGNSEGFNPELVVSYSIPDTLKQHYFYLDGKWKNHEGSMELVSESGLIRLPYHAKQVNIVAGNIADLEIFLDGKPIPVEYAGDDIIDGSKVPVEEYGLYNIINSKTAGTHLLEIVVNQPGFEIYTFTFG